MHPLVLLRGLAKRCTRADATVRMFIYFTESGRGWCANTARFNTQILKAPSVICDGKAPCVFLDLCNDYLYLRCLDSLCEPQGAD